MRDNRLVKLSCSPQHASVMSGHVALGRIVSNANLNRRLGGSTPFLSAIIPKQLGLAESSKISRG